MALVQIDADSNLWLMYQGAMIQTIQTRYCQQFLSRFANFKVHAICFGVLMRATTSLTA